MAGIPNGIGEILGVYGDPRGKSGKVNRAWETAHVIFVPVPWPGTPNRPIGGLRNAYNPSAIVTRVRLHREAADSWAECMREIWAYARRQIKLKWGCGKTTAQYDVLTYQYLAGRGLDLWGGSFAYRMKRSIGNELSTHAFAIAQDWNPAENAQGTPGTMPLWWVSIWKAEGWVWGGDWEHPDPMHVQRCAGY